MKLHEQPLADKIVNFLIILLVVMGTAAFGAVNQAPEEGMFLSKAFLVFFGAIIVLQLVPGMVLLGAMLKGIAGLKRKTQTAPAKKHE